MLKGFKEFIANGNAIDLAVGVVMGAAFKTVVDTIVGAIINPFVGLILPGSVGDLAKMKITIGDPGPGQVIFGWGAVASAAITFVMTAFAIYLFVILPMNAYRNRKGKPEDEKSNEEKMVALLERIADSQSPAT